MYTHPMLTRDFRRTKQSRRRTESGPQSRSDDDCLPVLVNSSGPSRSLNFRHPQKSMKALPKSRSLFVLLLLRTLLRALRPSSLHLRNHRNSVRLRHCKLLLLWLLPLERCRPCLCFYAYDFDESQPLMFSFFTSQYRLHDYACGIPCFIAFMCCPLLHYVMTWISFSFCFTFYSTLLTVIIRGPRSFLFNVDPQQIPTFIYWIVVACTYLLL
jgi:hypothetical protein